MTEEEKFMDELLQDDELKSEQQSEAYHDLLLLQIRLLQELMEHNFAEAEKEVKIINDWALSKNHALQVKIEWIEKKLEAFIRERKEKTIDLAHGILKYHKKPDKVEITDLDEFLKYAKPEMLTVIPEQVKPDLAKVKAYTKTHLLPKGVTVIEGKEEFSYKIKGKENENGRQEETGDTAQSAMLHRVAV